MSTSTSASLSSEDWTRQRWPLGCPKNTSLALTYSPYTLALHWTESGIPICWSPTYSDAAPSLPLEELPQFMVGTQIAHEVHAGDTGVIPERAAAPRELTGRNLAVDYSSLGSIMETTEMAMKKTLSKAESSMILHVFI